MSEVINAPKVTGSSEKQYTLRALCAKDIFPMIKILSKIKINEFTKAFDSDDLKSLVSSLSIESGEDGESKKNKDDVLKTVGVSVALNMVNIVLENLPNCEQEIYVLLAGLSSLNTTQIGALPMDAFINMIVDVIKKDEFMGFIKGVLKLLK